MLKCILCQTVSFVNGFLIDESSNVQVVSLGFREVNNLLLCDNCLNGLAVYSDEYKTLYEKVENFKNSLQELL